MSCILKASQLSKMYHEPIPVEIFNSINLEIRAGETVAIVGKSGEGKTTLLHLLGTLEEPTAGSVEICGELATPHNSSLLRNTYIGFIFQAYHLLDEWTVLENVLMPARIGQKPTAAESSVHHRALELLQRVGLSHRLSFPTKLLSGGEKQRVAIARALINDPPLLLADEPSGNLDKAHSEEIYSLLLAEVEKGNKALIVVTHDLTLASQCKKSYSLQNGKLS